MVVGSRVKGILLKSAYYALHGNTKPTHTIHTEPNKSAKDNISAWLTTAMERHQREDFDAAAQAHRQVLDADPGHVDALYYLGVVYYQLDQAVQALPLLDKGQYLPNVTAQNGLHISKISLFVTSVRHLYPV